MSRRRTQSLTGPSSGMPECLRRFDWREWRPTAPAGHPDPYYVEWYLAVCDWQDAKAAWMSGRPVLLPPERPLPPPEPYKAPFLDARSDWKSPAGALATGPPVHHEHFPPLDN